MRTKVALLGLVIAVVLALASPASAKGPSEGTIEGEGLEAPIAISHGEGTPGGDRLIEDVGFFEVTFGMFPSGRMTEAPTTDLGPELTIRWRVPGPDGLDDEIVQSLYPYAEGGPLTYTVPGQPFFEIEETIGGWFRAPDRLLDTLVAMGVPDEPAIAPAVATSSGPGSGSRWTPIGASLAAMVLLGAGLAVFSRRRGEVAPAAG
jgi:hypothetical protein